MGTQASPCPRTQRWEAELLRDRPLGEPASEAAASTGGLQAASRPGLCRAARLLARGAAPGASRATVACGVKRNYAVSRASSRVPSRASLLLCVTSRDVVRVPREVRLR